MLTVAQRVLALQTTVKMLIAWGPSQSVSLAGIQLIPPAEV